jgi:hypothetical protein
MVKMMNGVAIGGRDDAVTIPRPRDPRPSKEEDEATE